MKKIYVVDDDPNIVDFLTVVLEKEGFLVASQMNDNDAVENIARAGADLVILDVMFPEDDSRGFTIARDLRLDKRTADIPILVLSAINERHIYIGDFSHRDLDESWLPADDVIEKPVAPRELVRKIKLLLGSDYQGIPGVHLREKPVSMPEGGC